MERLCQNCTKQDFLSAEAWRGFITPEEYRGEAILALRDLSLDAKKLTREEVERLCVRYNFPPNVQHGLRAITTKDLEIISGELEELKSRSSCALCRLLLVAMSGRDFNDSSAGSIKWWGPGQGFPVGSIENRLVFVEDDMSKAPWIISRVGRAITTSQIDFQLVRKWLNLCETVHGNSCSQLINISDEDGSDRITNLRVIDTNDCCVVDAPDGCRYLALSYVWGKTAQIRLLNSNKKTLMMPGGIRNLLNQLPNTIRDAIELVNRIGEKYLWVDTLCLIQDNESDMANGIKFMDIVYRGAIATIVAGTGTDANAGLPGVRPGSRQVEQYIEEVAPDIRMMVLRDVEYYLKKSKYWTRGWTFQEQVLSCRSIIFINNCVYFRCLKCAWSEDTTGDKFPEHANRDTWTSLTSTCLSPETNPLDAYQNLAHVYSRKQLSNYSDAINAFTGILRLLSDGLKTQLLEGLPTSSFDISILFSGSNLHRRPGFPSYSWAGWGGPIEWPATRDLEFQKWTERPSRRSAPQASSYANEWLDIATWIDWFVRTPDGNIRPVVENGWQPEIEGHVGYNKHRHSLWQKRRPHAPHMPMIGLPKTSLLLFWTYSLYLMLKPSYQALTEKSRRRSVKIDVLSIIDQRGRVCGHLIPNNIDLIQMETPVEFLILSESSERIYEDILPEWESSPGPPRSGRWLFRWVMLVTWSNGVAERRGIGTVDEDAVCQSYGSGPFWKEILLG